MDFKLAISKLILKSPPFLMLFKYIMKKYRGWRLKIENIIRNPYDLTLLSNCNSCSLCAFMSLSTHNSKIAIQHLAIALLFLNRILEQNFAVKFHLTNYVML